MSLTGDPGAVLDGSTELVLAWEPCEHCAEDGIEARLVAGAWIRCSLSLGAGLFTLFSLGV